MPKFKYKERILKAAREKQLVTYKGALSWFLNRNFLDKKELAQNNQNDEKQGPTTKITQQSYHLESKDR